MNILEKRKAAGITQAEAATKLRINRSTIAKWETGVAKPRAAMLPRLAKMYRCTIDELYDHENEQGGE